MVFTKIKPEFSTVTGRVTKDTKAKINSLADAYGVSQADIVRSAVETITELDQIVFDNADEEGVSIATYINHIVLLRMKGNGSTISR